MGGGGMGGGGTPRAFYEQYRVHSVAGHSSPATLEYGDKIVLPPSALDALQHMEVSFPMLFKLENVAPPGAPGQDLVVQGPRDHGAPGLVNLFGIESPGLTASLALADHVAAMLE